MPPMDSLWRLRRSQVQQTKKGENIMYLFYEPKSSGSETTVTENSKTGIKFNGKYRLKNSNTGKWCDDANIYIIVFKDGSWRSHGNYGKINVN